MCVVCVCVCVCVCARAHMQARPFMHSCERLDEHARAHVYVRGVSE